ncbi:MAG TPA: hypothetical protein VFZ66_15220 [Herpetosiphonaceae bacterium]
MSTLYSRLRSRFSRVQVAALLGAIAIASMFSVTTQGVAALDRRYVCWSSLWVRNQPVGHAIAILYRGEAFDRERSTFYNGEYWSYGFAWGGENVWGWVQHAGLTSATGSC